MDDHVDALISGKSPLGDARNDTAVGWKASPVRSENPGGAAGGPAGAAAAIKTSATGAGVGDGVAAVVEDALGDTLGLAVVEAESETVRLGEAVSDVVGVPLKVGVREGVSEVDGDRLGELLGLTEALADVLCEGEVVRVALGVDDTDGVGHRGTAFAHVRLPSGTRYEYSSAGGASMGDNATTPPAPGCARPAGTFTARVASCTSFGWLP